MLPAQTLAQNEEILGADGDDEREAESDAGEEGGEHASTLRLHPLSVQLMILQMH